jgi:polar amino acid transport system substrate-binding protein
VARRRLFSTLLLACLLGGAANAANVATPAAEKRDLVLAFSELAPWKIKDDGGRFGGAYVEIVGELARRLGRGMRIHECPHKRCLKLLENGEADLIIGVRRSPEREAYLQFLQTPYRRSSADKVFYVRRSESNSLARYDDLYGRRIGVKNGSEYFDRFDADSRLVKDIGPNNLTNLQKLLLRRVDVVVIPEDQAAVLTARSELSQQIEPALFRVPDPTPRSVAVSRRSSLLTALPELERAMQAMRDDGSLTAIYERHYYRPYGVTRQQIRLD